MARRNRTLVSESQNKCRVVPNHRVAPKGGSLLNCRQAPQVPISAPSRHWWLACQREEGSPAGQQVCPGITTRQFQEPPSPPPPAPPPPCALPEVPGKQAHPDPSAWTAGSIQHLENVSHRCLMLEFLLSSLEELSRRMLSRGEWGSPQSTLHQPFSFRFYWACPWAGFRHCHTCHCKASLYTPACVRDSGTSSL